MHLSGGNSVADKRFFFMCGSDDVSEDAVRLEVDGLLFDFDVADF